MRLFQLFTFGRPYLDYFNSHRPLPSDSSYGRRLDALFDDRYVNSQILQPVLTRAEHARICVADDDLLQRAWAREHRMPTVTSLDAIVLAQIEDHRSEVFYCMNPVVFDSAFLKRLPGCVRKTLCWRAAPFGRADFSEFDLRLTFLPNCLQAWQRVRQRSAWFEAAHDSVATEYSRVDREIDVAFIGGYGRLHTNRNVLIQRVAELSSRYRVQIHLAVARSTRWVDAVPLARFVLPAVALPPALRQVTKPAIYGRAMYEVLGQAKIVVNAAINMAERHRSNMRCWEAMGCGALMLSDEGVYPPNMIPGRDFETYRDTDDALAKIERILVDYDSWRPVAEQGLATMQTAYSKAGQWAAFEKLVESI